MTENSTTSIDTATVRACLEAINLNSRVSGSSKDAWVMLRDVTQALEALLPDPDVELVRGIFATFRRTVSPGMENDLFADGQRKAALDACVAYYKEHKQ